VENGVGRGRLLGLATGAAPGMGLPSPAVIVIAALPAYKTVFPLLPCDERQEVVLVHRHVIQFQGCDVLQEFCHILFKTRDKLTLE
jgi:hypothetical protein